MATYLPSSAINSNYKYSVSGDSYLVRTNENCYTNYNTTYCDCYYIYPKLDYISSERSSCNYSNYTSSISYNNFTSDIFYRIDLPSILIIFIIFWLVIIYLPYRIISRLFGRWLKC